MIYNIYSEVIVINLSRMAQNNIRTTTFFLKIETIYSIRCALKSIRSILHVNVGRVYSHLRRLNGTDIINVTTVAVETNGTMLFDVCSRFLTTVEQYGKSELRFVEKVTLLRPKRFLTSKIL